MDCPNEEDWSGYKDDFDARDAYKVFFGLKNEETISLYQDNVRERYTDLRFMPERAFRYYIIGFANYVVNAKVSEIDREFVLDCFVNLLDEKIDTKKEFLSNAVEAIVDAIESNLLFIEAMDRTIYGDLVSKSREILFKCNQINGVSD